MYMYSIYCIYMYMYVNVYIIIMMKLLNKLVIISVQYFYTHVVDYGLCVCIIIHTCTAHVKELGNYM